jgi:hypothetical protein
MTTVAQLEAAGITVALDGDDACILTLPDDGAGPMDVRVAIVDGELSFCPTRSSLQRRALSMVAP